MSHLRFRQVLGPFNSGTSLMGRYLGQLYRAGAPLQGEIWKHSVPPRFINRWKSKPLEPKWVRPLDELPATLYICMVRTPYWWLLSTLRRQYGLIFQTRAFDFGARLRSPVILRGEPFSNAIVLWNVYYQRYFQYLGAPHKHINVRLEDLVLESEKTLLGLEHYLERRPASDLDSVIKKVAARPSKPHNTYGSEWIEKYRPENVRRYISAVDLAFINQHLDFRLLDEFGYLPCWSKPEIS